jgi:hypothetical protein
MILCSRSLGRSKQYRGGAACADTFEMQASQISNPTVFRVWPDSHLAYAG